MARINTVFSLTDEMSSPLRNIQNETSKLHDGMSALSSKLIIVNQGLELVKKAISGIKAIGGVFGNLVSEAGEVQAITARLTVALGDANLAVEKFKEIQQFASVTPFDVQGTAQAYIMLKNAGMETESLLDTIRMIGDLAQGNNQAFNNMALNMMQIKANGKATAMDLRQFATFGVPITEALKEIGREGDMSFDAVYQAMIHLTSAGGKFYNSMSMGASTLQGRMANLQDSIQQLKASIGQTLLPTVQKAQMGLADFISNLKVWFEETSGLKNKLNDIFTDIGNNLNKIVAGIINVGTVAGIVATGLATAWAVVHWRFTLISTLLISLGGIFVDVANDNAKLDNSIGRCEASMITFGKTAGMIAGVVKASFAGIHNTIAGLWNFILEASKDISMVIYELGDAISNPIQYVKDELSGVNRLNRKIRETNFYRTIGYPMDFQEIQSPTEIADEMADMFADIGKLLDQSFPEYTPEKTNTEGLKVDLGDSFKFASDGSLLIKSTDETDVAQNYRDLLSTVATERFFKGQSQIIPTGNTMSAQITINATSNDEIAKQTEMAVNTAFNKIINDMNETLYTGVA